MSLPNDETLPPELWLEIFVHLDERSYSGLYTPFQPLAGAGDVRSAYSAVVLVCRNWRDWATSFLYRNVKAPDSDSTWTRTHPEYGRWVRRMSLLSDSLSPTELFGICPNIAVLVRRHPQRLKFDTNAPSPLSLKRLDWSIYSQDASENPLWEVLCAAPNLEYLFLGMQRRFTRFSHDHTKIVHLPRLRTLHIGVANVGLLRSVSLWSIPSLTTLIMDNPLIERGMSLVWAAHGSHLQTIELANRFLPRAHSLARYLQSCPTLRELNYHIFTTVLPAGAYSSVTVVGMHISPDPELLRDLWEHLEQHIITLAAGLFPNLRTLRLYEMPEWLFAHDRFALMLKPLIDRGCALEML
ncbi:hypothetical protein C8F04DRAFT_1067923 [Mycena alexandri]|uniref:F-box domain-containing protein n=1 Tax=Mycena alexandri TaxID=1745969 RepID=A0AAD6XH81_9AGAR|nr:hypothetical protein C8F04DRAFT_1067923 [Mycena alexandri]